MRRCGPSEDNTSPLNRLKRHAGPPFLLSQLCQARLRAEVWSATIKPEPPRVVVMKRARLGGGRMVVSKQSFDRKEARHDLLVLRARIEA